MRCPKCKFISFDDLSNCAKCAHDLSALAAELNGTCTETHLEFFLGPVIQTQNFEENEFSDSQPLPPIDHGEMNFDDTSSGQFAAFNQLGEQTQGIDFDETAGVVLEDDVSIELGDIMPIDLDQLEIASVEPEQTADSLSVNDREDIASATSSLDDDIDLNLSDEFANNNLDLDLNESFSDIDLDDTTLDTGDDTTVIHPSAKVADDTVLAVDSADISTEEMGSGLDLDDELVAELSDSSEGYDDTATLTKSAGGFDTVNLSSTGEFSDGENTLNLDESLLAELSEDESDIEDLTGEFPPIPEGEEPELSTLDFSDIDVSDLVDSQGSQVLNDTTNTVAGVTEDGTIPNVSNQAGEGLNDQSDPQSMTDQSLIYNEIDELDLDNLDENDLEMLDDDDSIGVAMDGAPPQHDSANDEVSETELVLEEEDDDGPPDLPS